MHATLCAYAISFICRNRWGLFDADSGARATGTINMYNFVVAGFIAPGWNLFHKIAALRRSSRRGVDSGLGQELFPIFVDLSVTRALMRVSL